MTEGYLYIISNKNFPGWIKIGITENLDKRLQVYQTASPFRDYVLEYSLKHPEYKKAEKLLKESIKPFAKRIRNEWSEMDVKIAISRLEEQLEDFKLT